MFHYVGYMRKTANKVGAVRKSAQLALLDTSSALASASQKVNAFIIHFVSFKNFRLASLLSRTV